MPGPLNYTQYYQEQMSFLVSYIENKPLNAAQQTRAQRIKKNLARQQVHFTDDFLAITPGDELLATRIGYIPPKGARITHRASDKDQANAYRYLSLLAPDKDRANAYRHLTRHRLVYGPVDFYLDSQFATPTEIPIITTCAINLMGTSPHDSAKFNPNGVFNTAEYQKECDKLADFIVSAAKQHGHERLVMPAFGVGLYIKTLDPVSQIKARELMYKAFAQAAQRQQLHVDWIVWAKAPQKDQLQKQLSALSNQYIKPIIHEDFLQYGQELLANKVNAVLLNAGSDRTVGGRYTINMGCMDKLPVEEQMTQQSDLALLHTEYNRVMAENFKKQVAARRMNELMISAVIQAVEKYQAWYSSEADHRGPNGFFSWLRHGSTGQRRATDLVAQITRRGTDAEGLVNNLLKNPSTTYHRHSLSSFLLDELGKLAGSTWYGLKCNEKLLYEQHKVVAHLEYASQRMSPLK